MLARHTKPSGLIATMVIMGSFALALGGLHALNPRVSDVLAALVVLATVGRLVVLWLRRK